MFFIVVNTMVYEMQEKDTDAERNVRARAVAISTAYHAAAAPLKSSRIVLFSVGEFRSENQFCHIFV